MKIVDFFHRASFWASPIFYYPYFSNKIISFDHVRQVLFCKNEFCVCRLSTKLSCKICIKKSIENVHFDVKVFWISIALAWNSTTFIRLSMHFCHTCFILLSSCMTRMTRSHMLCLFLHYILEMYTVLCINVSFLLLHYKYLHWWSRFYPFPTVL